MRNLQKVYSLLLVSLLLIFGAGTYALACDYGGPGATGCSVGEVCSVDCGAGYYACCNDNLIFEDECYCEKQKLALARHALAQ